MRCKFARRFRGLSQDQLKKEREKLAASQATVLKYTGLLATPEELASTLRASLTYDFLQNFSMMFNQLADFPMLSSRFFTFQMLCLMLEEDPPDLEKALWKAWIGLEGCCIFNNDYEFHEFKQVAEIKLEKREEDALRQRHILHYVSKQLAKKEAKEQGPWVIQLYTSRGMTEKFSSLAVIKYDAESQEVVILTSPNVERVLKVQDLIDLADSEDPSQLDSVFPWLKASVVPVEMDVGQVDIFSSSQKGASVVPGESQDGRRGSKYPMVHRGITVYTLQRALLSPQQCVKYMAIRNSFIKFSE